MAVLYCYMDDSGKLQDPTVSLGVVVIDERMLGSLGDRWNQTFRKIRKLKPKVGSVELNYVHAKDAVHLVKNFKRWKAEDRDELLLQLALVAKTSAEYVFPVVLTTEDFKRAPEPVRRKLHGVHEMAFEAAILRIQSELGRDDYAFLVYDDDEKYSMEIYKLLNRLKTRHPSLRKKIVGCLFGNDIYFPGIQAADMLAYFAKEEHERDKGVPGSLQSPVYAAFASGRAVNHSYTWDLTGPGLGQLQR